jgi:hypothetical protein
VLPLAKNIEEGARELRRHLENPDPLYSVPMSITEKVVAAFNFRRLPPPIGAGQGFRRDMS